MYSIIIDNKYKLIKEIGKGRISTVYLAFEIYSDTKYAIKIFNNSKTNLLT